MQSPSNSTTTGATLLAASLPDSRVFGLSGTAFAKVLAVFVVLAYWMLAAMLHPAGLEGDEQRYYDDAVNLTKGYFVADDHPRIFNGPGYPFFLYPFVKLGAPLTIIRFTGAVMIGLSAWFLFLAGRRLMPEPWAIAVAAFCSFHPNLLRQGHMLMTEPMTQVLLAIYLWCLIVAVQTEKRWWWWAAGAAVSIWMLTMTRVFMGHVITVMVIGSAILAIFKSLRSAARRTFVVMLGALFLCAPYLRFTYNKTGSYFLWSTSAGELLYWLTSHEGGENGHWYHESEVFGRPELAVRHADFFRSIADLGPLEKEAKFKEVAIRRIKESPRDFARNWVCNVTRLFYGFPRSLEREKITTFPLFVFNTALLGGVLLGLALTWLRKENPPAILWVLLLMAAFYTGGSTLAPALPRYFLGIVPVVAIAAASLLARVPWRRLWAPAH
ncbi:MAG: glycosyltransferase family 39 protein [Verrucomicrobiaceae bacterium]|nr:glycosyltransferase family 39 protein [Verrucomicrobiaceae bacterium]